MKASTKSQHKRRAYAMNIVPHHHHSYEATFSKIQQFFAEFHVSSDPAELQCLQAARLCGHGHLPRRVRSGVPAALLLPEEEGRAVFHPIREGYVLPLPELLRHPLAQVHAAPGHGRHPEGHRTADERGAQERPHHRRLAVQPQPFQESGAAGSRLRPRQRHVREGLPHAHARLE